MYVSLNSLIEEPGSQKQFDQKEVQYSRRSTRLLYLGETGPSPKDPLHHERSQQQESSVGGSAGRPRRTFPYRYQYQLKGLASLLWRGCAVACVASVNVCAHCVSAKKKT